MRNLFYGLAALLSFGVGWFYYQDVASQTATVNKLRLVARDGLVITAGTVVDDAFLREYVTSQPVPKGIAEEFQWALSDDAVTLINLRGQVFGSDVPSGSFLQRAHFFLAPQEAFARRIHPGNRAFSIPFEESRAVENFLDPGARVDVIGTFVAEDNTVRSRRVLENVEVMGVGAYDRTDDFREQDNPEYQSVTLQAPAEVVEAFLALEVQTVGDLTLVLRNPCDGASDCISLGQ